MADLDDDDRIDQIKRHCVALREFFDSVQIIAVRKAHNEEDASTVFKWGDGSWFERYGAVRYWLLQQEAEPKDYRLPQDDDDG